LFDQHLWWYYCKVKQSQLCEAYIRVLSLIWYSFTAKTSTTRSHLQLIHLINNLHVCMRTSMKETKKSLRNCNRRPSTQLTMSFCHKNSETWAR
jgi:hypothetical protein